MFINYSIFFILFLISAPTFLDVLIIFFFTETSPLSISFLTSSIAEYKSSFSDEAYILFGLT
ncbi:MAG: hypothetical protein AAB866_03125 [Patescibacteria group bacterium]